MRGKTTIRAKRLAPVVATDHQVLEPDPSLPSDHDAQSLHLSLAARRRSGGIPQERGIDRLVELAQVKGLEEVATGPVAQDLFGWRLVVAPRDGQDRDRRVERALPFSTCSPPKPGSLMSSRMRSGRRRKIAPKAREPFGALSTS